MSQSLITFRSVTPAQRGESALRRAGIPCALQPTPRWMEERGCGYSLQLRKADILAAVAELRRSGVPFGKVYLPGENGTMEEVSM